MQIQTFRNAPIYGVKMYDNLVRTGVKVATAASYNQSRKGFSLTWTSTEGVCNSYQVIRFEDIRVARLLAQSVNGDIVKQRGEAEFVKLPIAMPDGGIVWAWVNSKKLNFIPPSTWERFKADYPTEEEEISLSNLDDLDENKSI